jgi:hypothetical protein
VSIWRAVEFWREGHLERVEHLERGASGEKIGYIPIFSQTILPLIT